MTDRHPTLVTLSCGHTMRLMQVRMFPGNWVFCGKCPRETKHSDPDFQISRGFRYVEVTDVEEIR
jgi:hypothetical protein